MAGAKLSAPTKRADASGARDRRPSYFIIQSTLLHCAKRAGWEHWTKSDPPCSLLGVPYDRAFPQLRRTRMRAKSLTLFVSVISLTGHLAAQPAITSWRLNTTGETGTYTLQNGTKGTLPA